MRRHRDERHPGGAAGVAAAVAPGLGRRPAGLGAEDPGKQAGAEAGGIQPGPPVDGRSPFDADGFCSIFERKRRIMREMRTEA